MKRGGRDLHARCRGETKSPANAHTSKAKPRREEDLFVTGMRSGFEERRIHFKFRPKLPRRLILESRVPLELASKLCRAAGRQVSAKRGLDIEPPPTFAHRERRRQHGVACTVTVRSCGRRRCERSEERRVG